MDAASIEEINKVRRALGMKPLPVPGAAPEPSDTKKPSSTEDDEPGSTLESREAQATENFKKVREAEEARRRREEKAAAIKKARELALRNAVVEGKTLADEVSDDELDVKNWLKGQKKRQKKLEEEKRRREEQERAEREKEKAAAAEHSLAGVKVAHDLNDFLGAEEQILTLKDTGVLEAEEEGDELENIALREQEKLREKLELKKKKPVYDPTEDETMQGGILSKYDEEIYGKKKKAFTIDLNGVSTVSGEGAIQNVSAPVEKKQVAVAVDSIDDILGRLHLLALRLKSPCLLSTGPETAAPTSDYLDPSEVKVRKPKKKKSKSTRRQKDEDDILFQGDMANGEEEPQEMEIDSAAATVPKKRRIVDDNFVDDDDLQSSLSKQRREALKKRKRLRPEDLARQLREQTENGNGEAEDEEAQGEIMDEVSRFVDSLQPELLQEEKKLRKPKVEEVPTVTAMQDEESSSSSSSEDEDEEMHDVDASQSLRETSAPLAEVPSTGVEEEKTVAQGLGATLALLRERRLIESDGKGEELTEQFRQRQRFLAELHRRMAQFDAETKAQRERDRQSGKLDRMSAREREEWQRQQNALREQHQARIIDQLYREGYRPNVELKYIDEHGRRLDQKEAFKELSHQFHGKTSGKGKTEKKLKKLEQEKKRMAQSVLDASQSVGGMSTAASQQGKKRREAGVRLA